MISILSIHIEKPEKIQLNQNSSSLFHGVLMEHLSPEVASQLHEKSLRPYRQGLSFVGKDIFWNIITLTKEARENIISPLLSQEFSTIMLKHHQIKIKIINKNVQELSYDDLIQQTYLSTCPREITLEFISPTAFKQAGEYVMIPTIPLILQSAMKKFDAFSSQTEIFSAELLEDLEKHCVLSRYHLRSTRFHLEGNKVPAFYGSLSYYIKGPQPLVNTVHLLCQYGQYAGIGIKSALGMGEMKTERKYQ